MKSTELLGFRSFTKESLSVLMNANIQCVDMHHPAVSAEHLFLSSLNGTDIKEAAALRSRIEDFRNQVKYGEQQEPTDALELGMKFSRSAVALLNMATQIAKESSTGEVGSEHLLKSALQQRSVSELLSKFGFSAKDVLRSCS